MSNKAAITTPKAQPEFFAKNGKYQVAPGTTTVDLHNDIHCWLESAQEIISTVANELEEDDSGLKANPRAAARLLYGADHLLTMVLGASIAAFKLEHAQGGVA